MREKSKIMKHQENEDLTFKIKNKDEFVKKKRVINHG